MPVEPIHRCPRCQGGLVEISATDLNELRCAACHGSWVGNDGVNHVADLLGMRPATFRRRVHAASRPLLQPLTCLDCRKPMKRLSLRGVDVDACHLCGSMWFDAGELPRLSQGVLEDPRAGAIRERILTHALTEDPGSVLPLAQKLMPPERGVRSRLAGAAQRLDDFAGRYEEMRGRLGSVVADALVAGLGRVVGALEKRARSRDVNG